MNNNNREEFIKVVEIFLIFFFLLISSNKSQHLAYDVTDIYCTYSVNHNNLHNKVHDSITAKLRKPEGFKGNPLFADDRFADPFRDEFCQIRADSEDPTELWYNLKITNFERCGVKQENELVSVRIWFPQFSGVVMQSDQELTLMCKPPEPIIIQNKAAGFAGSLKSEGRISGVFSGDAAKLEYEVALYKEAPTTTKMGNNFSGLEGNSNNNINNNNNNELPVTQAVPIGTKLQIRARINPNSVWKYVKLMEITVSSNQDNPHTDGSVFLVKDGCRNGEFSSIIPHQPTRYLERPNEVYLDFEAFLLSSMREESTLWIHSQIKACMDELDCLPDFCLDLHDQKGHGRRRRKRREIEGNRTTEKEIIGNIKYAVLMPGEFLQQTANIESSCNTFLAISVILGCLLFLAAFLMCWLASKLHSALVSANDSTKNIEDFVRNEKRNYNESCYTGRPTTH